MTIDDVARYSDEAICLVKLFCEDVSERSEVDGNGVFDGGQGKLEGFEKSQIELLDSGFWVAEFEEELEAMGVNCPRKRQQ